MISSLCVFLCNYTWHPFFKKVSHVKFHNKRWGLWYAGPSEPGGRGRRLPPQTFLADKLKVASSQKVFHFGSTFQKMCQFYPKLFLCWFGIFFREWKKLFEIKPPLIGLQSGGVDYAHHITYPPHPPTQIFRPSYGPGMYVQYNLSHELFSIIRMQYVVSKEVNWSLGQVLTQNLWYYKSFSVVLMRLISSYKSYFGLELHFYLVEIKTTAQKCLNLKKDCIDCYDLWWNQLLIILYVLSKTEWMNIPKMYATKICNLRLSKTFLKVWCSSKVLFLSNINMKLWKIAFCCVCSSHKHSNNASVWEYLVKFWHYQITYCKSSLHRYLSTYFSKNSSWVLCM